MLKNRFLSVFALAFAAGIATPFLAENGWEAVVFILFIALALVFGGLYAIAHFKAEEGKKILLYPAIVAVGLALGAGWLCLRALPYENYSSFVGEADTVKGTVTENGSSTESKYLEIQVEESRISLPEGTKIRLYCTHEDVISIGDYVTAEVTYSHLSRPSERASTVRLTANGYVSAHERGESFVSSIRYWLAENCKTLYEPYGSTGVAQALTVRERSLLTPEVNEAYRNAGLSHLLAISGLHLSVLVVMLRKLLFACRFRKRLREILALAVILLYCFLTGFSPSIVRAAVMVGFMLVGEMLLRETDGLTLLSMALLVLLMFNPYAVLSVSLQLSFLSCLGIILLEPPITELQKKIRGIGETKHPFLRSIAAGSVSLLLTSCSAVVFTFPVIAYTFGSLSWLSPFSNLIFVPLFTPILTLLLLSVLVYSLFPWLGTALAFLPGQALRLMEGLFRLLEQRDIGTLYVSDSWVLLPVLLSCAAIACMLLFRKRAVLLFLCFSLTSVLSFSVCAMAEAFAPPEEYVLLSAEESFLYVSHGKKGAFLDLGDETAAYQLPEGYEVDSYVVTQTDEASLDRMCSTFGDHKVSKLYLPLTDDKGRPNDLADFVTMGETVGCEVITYLGAAGNDLLEYDSVTQTVKTAFGVSLLLGEEGCELTDTYLWVLSSDLEQCHTLQAELICLPSGTSLWEGFSHTNVRFYTSTIIYRDGEVYIP